MGNLKGRAALVNGFVTGVVVASAVFASSATAQALPPGVIDPGLQRERLEEQQRQRAIESRARQIQVPAMQGEQPAEGDALPDQSPEFELQSIAFNVSEFVEKQELEDLAAGYVGRPITFADLNELIRKINARYSEMGQLTARAIIPPQSLDNGALRIVLVEAKVDGVSFSGDSRRVREAFYRERLQLHEGATLDSPMLIESIRRFNTTTPGPQLSAGLAPGERFGTTRVDIEAFEPDPWAWSLFVNNYGNESTGREQYGGTLNWFSPTGVADNLGIMLVATSGTQYYNLRYSRPVNRSNGVAWVEAGTNSLQIEKGPLADLNIEGESTNYGLGYDHPWQLSEKWLLLGGVAYTFQNSETTIEGVPLSEVDIQEAVLSGRFEYRAAPWYVRYEQRLRQAATDNKVTGDSGSFTLLDGDTYAARPLGKRFELVGKLGWQYATKDDELPSALLKQFGGLSNMRGYDPGIIAAPWGAHVSLETHWNLSERWRPYAFVDYGRAMQLGTEDVDLASAGLGLNVQWGKHFSANLIAAAALEDVVPDQDSGQAMLQIVIR